MEDDATRRARLEACEITPRARDGAQVWLGVLIISVCAAVTLGLVTWWLS